MTQDFKNNILAWLVGKYEIEDPGVNAPTFSNTTETTSNFYTDLQNEFSNGFTIKDIIQTKFKSNNAGIMVVYGNYNDETAQEHGFIDIINEKGETIQILKSFNNGTLLKTLVCLNVTDGGVFYGIDSNSSGGSKRVILLNNFTIKLPSQTNYEIVLRNSYIIPNTSGAYEDIADVVGIKKSPNDATYLIYGTRTTQFPFVTKFKINVGSDNEWVEYGYLNTLFWAYAKDLYVTDWEKCFFKVGCYDVKRSDNVTGYAEYTIDQEDVTTMTRNYKTALKTNSNERLGLGDINIVSNSKAYLSYYIRNENAGYYLQCLTAVNNSSRNVIYEINSDPVIIGQYIRTKAVQGNIFFLLPEWNVNADSGTISIGLLVYDEPYTEVIAEMTAYTEINAFYMSNAFNLYNYNVLLSEWNDEDESETSTLYNNQIVFNINNYNGEPFLNIGSLKPNSSVLYDDNNVAIFARNLYNRVITANITTSTVEVPNTYLNDTIIGGQNLLSETNNILNSVSSNIQKNIYETLNINFINTLNIKDSNDPNNEVLNMAGASRLNDSISLTRDFREAKASKYRLNYSDNTSLIRTFLDSQVTCLNNTATYDFVIYTGKLVNSIDIISNDEATIYQTINTSNLSINKYYKITQEVEII